MQLKFNLFYDTFLFNTILYSEYFKRTYIYFELTLKYNFLKDGLKFILSLSVLHTNSYLT